MVVSSHQPRACFPIAFAIVFILLPYLGSGFRRKKKKLLLWAKWKWRKRLCGLNLHSAVQCQGAVLDARVWVSPSWTNQSPNSLACGDRQITLCYAEKINRAEDSDWANCTPVDYKWAWLSSGGSRLPACIAETKRTLNFHFVCLKIQDHNRRHDFLPSMQNVSTTTLNDNQ